MHKFFKHGDRLLQSFMNIGAYVIALFLILGGIGWLYNNYPTVGMGVIWLLFILIVLKIVEVIKGKKD